MVTNSGAQQIGMSRSGDLAQEHESAHSQRRVWRIRPLYVGGTGVLAGRIVEWSGTAEMMIGRYEGPNSASRCMSVDDARVSRRHARMYIVEGKPYIEDLRSRNGTALNGEVLVAGEPRPMWSGDIIRVGQSFLSIRYEPAAELDAALPSVIGWSRAAGQLRRTIHLAASHSKPVLLLGEFGTGRTLAAKEIHRLSGRPGSLVTVGCQELTVDGLPQLFARASQRSEPEPGDAGMGHAGHASNRPARTLLFDEASRLRSDVKVALLKLLTGSEGSGPAERRPLLPDVRVLVSSSQHLMSGRVDNSFLASLHLQTEPTVVLLPALRERREDILLLAQYFGGPSFRPSPRLVSRLLAHSWPRNISELQDVVLRLESGNEEEVYASLSLAKGSPTETLLD